MSKREKNLVAIAVFMIVMVIAVGSTYAFWTTTQVQSDKNEINTTCLKVKLENKDISNQETHGITLNKAYPISDKEGLSEATPGYTFTITNECDIEVNYDINLESLKIADQGDFTPAGASEDDETRIKRETESKYIQPEYLIAGIDMVNNEVIHTLKDYTSYTKSYLTSEQGTSYDNRVLLSNETIDPKEKVTHTLKMWLKSDAPETQMNKHYQGKIIIYSWLGDSNPNPIVVKP